MRCVKIFESGRIGTMELKNRLVMPAMVTNFAESDGGLGDKLISYYTARAGGGFGLVIVEATAVSPDGRGFTRHPVLYNDAVMPGWRRLAESIHSAGGKVGVQLFHAGRQTYQSITGERPVAPSPVSSPKHNEIPRELTREDIRELVGAYGQAARRAKEAGLDGVEVQCGHGYLISQFISPVFNKRTDEYGGDLFSRMRFALEVLREVRRNVGGDYPVWARMSADDQMPGGITVEEAKVVAAILAGAGCDALHVSAGLTAGGYGKAASTTAPMYVPKGFNLADCEAIKKSVDVPIIAVGRINEPLLAEQALRENRADFIAMGRAAIADPELPHKAAADDYRGICPCIGCVYGCIHLMSMGQDISCTMNPAVGREYLLEKESPRAEKPRKVVVVGGGPAGMMAAATAARRGHRVVLFEKEGSLGGQFRLAAFPPGKQEIARGVAYYADGLRGSGVEIHLGREVTAETVLSEKPDVVLLATGSLPAMLPLPGVPEEKIATAHEVLAGIKNPGKKVAVIGAGLVGCETADFLAERNREITVIEMTGQIAADVPAAPRYHLLNRLQSYGVKFLLDSSIERMVGGTKLEVKTNDGEKVLYHVDTVILAAGNKPVNQLFQDLKQKCPEVMVIGDAKEVKNGFSAFRDGLEAGLSI